MSTQPNRALTVLPNSTHHTVLVELIEEVIEEIVGEKLARRACLGFRRIEKVIYFLNPLDLPQIPLSSLKIAANAGVTDRTIRRDLDAINALFEQTGGLRLHHWESGGMKWEEIRLNAEKRVVEDVIPNTFHWPSPGGILIDTVHNALQQLIRTGSNRIRKHEEEKQLTKQLVLKAISDPQMQEILRERMVNKAVKMAVKLDKKDDRERERAGNVLSFPRNSIISMSSMDQSFTAIVVGCKSQNLTLDDAVQRLIQAWGSDEEEVEVEVK